VRSCRSRVFGSGYEKLGNDLAGVRSPDAVAPTATLRDWALRGRTRGHERRLRRRSSDDRTAL